MLSTTYKARTILLADVGARTRTRSTTKVAYASRPSVSHPMAGKSLKNRLVAAESRAVDACSKLCLKIANSSSRAACNASKGGIWFSAVGWFYLLRIHCGFAGYIRTTVARANSPLITSGGRAMAREQCRVAESQSWESMADLRATRDD